MEPPYKPDGYSMLDRPWTEEEREAFEAHLASLPPPPTLRALDGMPDPRVEPDFEDGEDISPGTVRLAERGYPEPEDRATATLSEVGDQECVQDLLRPGRIHVIAAEEGSGKTYGAKEIGIRVAVAGGEVFETWQVLHEGLVLDLSEMHPDDDYRYEQDVLDSLDLDRSALAGRYYRLPLMTAAHGRPALMEPVWREWQGRRRWTGTR